MPEPLPELEQYRRRCEEQASMLESLTATNAALTGTIEELRRTIEELKETIRELQGRLGQNSRNSSRPPSKDGPGKPKPKSLRRKSERKPGGQGGIQARTWPCRTSLTKSAGTFRPNALDARILQSVVKKAACSPAARDATR